MNFSTTDEANVSTHNRSALPSKTHRRLEGHDEHTLVHKSPRKDLKALCPRALHIPSSFSQLAHLPYNSLQFTVKSIEPDYEASCGLWSFLSRCCAVEALALLAPQIPRWHPENPPIYHCSRSRKNTAPHIQRLDRSVREFPYRPKLLGAIREARIQGHMPKGG